MNKLTQLSQKILSVLIANTSRFKSESRGDVPGWVLVTVMTAGLVVAIWSIADGQLKSVLQNAIRSVSSP